MVRKFVTSQLAAKLLVLLAFTLLLPTAHASVLSVGGLAFPTQITPGGTVVGTASGTITTPSFVATWWEWVYRDPGNSLPGCNGNCLDFVYQFHNDINSRDVLERFSMSSFATLGMSASVNVGMDTLGVHDPINMTWSTDGEVIAFNFTPFGDQINRGETTQLMVIQTQATQYTDGYVSAQDGTAGSGVALAPAAIPEPASLGLMGAGLIVVGSFVRRKLGL